MRQITENIKQFSLFTLFLCLTACGSAGGEIINFTTDPTASAGPTTHAISPSPVPDIAPDAPMPPNFAKAAGLRAFLESADYASAIVVRFADDSGVRLRDGVWISEAGADVGALNVLRDALPTAVPARALPNVSEDEIVSARAHAAERGIALRDWNLVFTIGAPDAATAEAVLATLYADPLVAWAYPLAAVHTSGMQEDATAAGQIYLHNGPGALNVVAGWQAGLTGAGQTVIDVEYNWNFAHADLNTSATTTPVDTPFAPWATSDATIQHGTAVLGIVAAQNNGAGMIGIAPAATLHTSSIKNNSKQNPTATALPVLGTFLKSYAYKKENGGKKVGGEIVLIEVATSPLTPSECGTPTQKGCLPIEAYRGEFEAIQDLTALGVIVVEGAGNGQVDLDDKSQLACDDVAICTNLSNAAEDSGAILVGASDGAAMAKAWYTNCGTRVNVFAWGKDIVAPGYGDYVEISANPSDPNQWYTKKFGGTSGATALIGGVAALLQEHAAKVYAGLVPPTWDLYLNAAQMRTLLQLAGVAQSDSTCNIGKQPEVAAAMALLADGTVQPTCRTQDGTACALPPVGSNLPYAQECLAKAQDDPTFDVAPEYYNCESVTVRPAKHMDLDGDGRADLIAFSRTGEWYVDLSGLATAQSPGGLGKWDWSFASPTLEFGRLLPVVNDYNSDGRADLALYNSDTGQLGIAFTTDALLTAGTVEQWDLVLNYGTQPGWLAGARPFPGDYDAAYFLHGPNANGKYRVARTIDVALVMPDGRWMIDLRNPAALADATFELDLDVLTDEQKKAAPGWAYLPAPYMYNTARMTIAFKAPDGIAAGEFLYDAYALPAKAIASPDDFFKSTPLLGSNTIEIIPANYDGNGWDIGLRQANDGSWKIYTVDEDSVMQNSAPINLGGIECRPIAADYDGDDIDDRSVLCPYGEWRIAYSTKTYGANDLPDTMTLGGPAQALPGQVYAGGTSFEIISGTYEEYWYGCETWNRKCTIDALPPPIGPYFAECLALWADHPLSCLTK